MNTRKTAAIKPGVTLTITTPEEGTIGFVHVTSVSADGNVIGRLALTGMSSNSASALGFRAVDEAADALAFAAMELEEENLANLGVRFELPNGEVWRLGFEAGNLLVTEHCNHIAFQPLKAPKKYNTR